MFAPRRPDPTLRVPRVSFLKKILIALAAVLGLLGAVVLVALVPAVQRWFLLRQFATVPGLATDVQSVVAGFDRVTLIGVRVDHGVRAVRIARFEADYSLWALLARRELRLSRVEATGVFVDLSKSSPVQTQAGVAAAPAALPGVLGQVELPCLLHLDGLSVEGAGLLPAASGRPAIETKFTVVGGGLAPGRAGEIKIAASLRDPSPGAHVAGLRSQVNLQLEQDDNRRFKRLELKAGVDPDSAAFGAGDQLQITASLRQTAEGERYSVAVSTGLGAAARKLLNLDARLAPGQPVFTGEWRLDARSAQVQPYYLGGALPRFEAAGQGNFSFHPGTGAVAVDGRLNAVAAALENWQPRLRPLGEVRLSSGFNLAREGAVVSLNRLELNLAGATEVLSIVAHRAARLNLAERTVRIGPAESGEVLRVTLHGLPLAWVRPFVTTADVSGGTLTGELALVSEAGRATARTLKPLAIDAFNLVTAGRPLLLNAGLAADFDATAVGAHWQLALRNFSVRTPTGDRVRATGQVSFEPGPAPALSAKASYETDLPRLADTLLPGLGAVRTRGNLDAVWRGASLEVKRWSEQVNDATGISMLGVESLQPFTLDLASRRPRPAPPGQPDVLRIGIDRAPLAALLLGRRLPQPLSGSVEGVEFIVGLKDDALLLRTTRPGRATGLTYGPADAPWLRDVLIEFAPTAEWSPARASARAGEIRLRAADGVELGALNGELSFQPGQEARANVAFQLNLPGLATQPLLARVAGVAQGRASGEVRGVLAADGSGRVEARTTLNGLVARQGGVALPVANLSVQADFTPDRRVTVEAPLLLDRAGVRSDALLKAALARVPGGLQGDARITADNIALEDMLTVFGVFAGPLALAAPAQPSAVTTETGVVADTRPVWAGFSGTLTLDVKSVAHGVEWTMTNLKADLTVGIDEIKLAELRADFGPESKLRASGRLAHTAEAKPYRLGAEFTLTEFDAGKLFRALEASRAPTVEGLFTTRGRIESSGRTLDETLDDWRGQAELTSRQGVFRGLKRSTDKVSTASRAVELGAALGSLFGSDKVRETAERLAGNAFLVDQLATALGEFKYDQLTVRLARDQSLDVDIEELRLLAPELRLAGKGVVTHDPAKGLLERPLRFSTTLAVRGPVEEILGRLRALDTVKDDLGYTRMRDSIFVGGTLVRPDPTQFFARLAASRLTDFLTPNRPPPAAPEKPKP